MNLTLKVWRQKNANSGGNFETHQVVANEHMSFLEMLDVLNEDLVSKKLEPVAFEHDCREGICGACSMVIDGQPHGPNGGTTTCQLHMRVIQAGGFISVNTGNAPDGNSLPIEKEQSSMAMDAAECIGCGACVAACPNASAMLFVSAKVSHLALLPQGEIESAQRALKMVNQMDEEGFGNCSNVTACEAECPKEISVTNIARLNREYMTAYRMFTQQSIPPPEDEMPDDEFVDYEEVDETDNESSKDE